MCIRDRPVLQRGAHLPRDRAGARRDDLARVPAPRPRDLAAARRDRERGDPGAGDRRGARAGHDAADAREDAMSNGIYVATAGAVAQSNALDATANNIANASTAGFHGDRVTFREALTAARSPDIASVGAGTARIDSQAGALTQTEN